MTLRRHVLTPQMVQHEDFQDRGETHWIPYLMYFHRTDYRSAVLNTDRLGFRLSHGPSGEYASVAGRHPAGGGPVSLLAGSSTAFGVGSTSDATAIPSRLWSEHAPATPWLNFGGRGYCSTQEVLLYLLHHQRLPRVERIVILSGLNNLALAGLPPSYQSEYGAFFSGSEYRNQMDELLEKHRDARTTGLARLLRDKGRGRSRGGTRRLTAEPTLADERTPTLDERIATAVERTAHDLERWQLLARASGIRVCFAMQPFATWVREVHTPEETALFDELDQEGSIFWDLFGEVAPAGVGRRYAEEIAAVCEKHEVGFTDLNPAMARTATADDWLFVDRAHLTDKGYDLAAQLLASGLDLS
ncbi:SGNH/GDSL hydrolase family protein [Streptomyces sp. NBC_01262]|uniref:SGNH/GDSL hydrolase family protein n=1 Tax=Streptomyces sp. NBC_01262 TaxID=2903803 RepID=UPI002E36E6BD|nr:Inducer of phenazine A [Streptomyces sp. NBC_01262]